jgi:Tol biopolymer transport system component
MRPIVFAVTVVGLTPTLVIAQAPYVSASPVRTAMLFLPGTVNTDADEYGPAFSADGTRMYFVRRTDRRGHEAIKFTRFVDGGWTDPVTVPFSGTFYDKEPFLSPDGRWMFFASTRPAPSGGDDVAFDLWRVPWAGNGWGDPERLSDAVNSDEYDNYPSVAANGNLYFGSRREGGSGALDLYVSRLGDGVYQPAENLGTVVNSESTDADPFIAPDESYLIFSSTRPGGAGSGDLYICFRDGAGWTAPRSLGDTVNSDDFDYTPLVSPDGQYLFFSRGWGDLYYIEMAALPVIRPSN